MKNNYPPPTPEDFKQQAKLKDITFWPIRHCLICDYTLAYHLSEHNIFFDTACFCVKGLNIEQGSWDMVAERYNIQDHPSIINEMNKFWGFPNN